MGAFDNGLSIGAGAAARDQQIAEQQRVEKQNAVGAQLLDAINNASNIKPQTKDENGNIIHNPEYDKAQSDKQQLLSQYTSLYSPEQHASFAQRLHGLIFGHPETNPQQPALSPNSSPNTPPPDPNAVPVAAPPAGPVTPPHPMAPVPPGHPLHAITEGIKSLGEGIKNRAGAFANPMPPQAQPDPNLMAKYYRDPAEVAFERNKELWGVRGENALAVAQERTKALMASLAARPPRMLSQTTIPDLLDQLKVDPDQVIYGPDGQEISPAKLAEMPPGTIAREFRAGANVFYALGDQNSKTLNVNGHIYDIPAVGPVNVGGPNQNASVIGQATSTLPKQGVSVDQYGNVTSSAHTTAVPPAAAAPTAPPSTPVLNTRPPISSNAPPPPNPLAAVNANIASANAASPRLNKGKPVSVNAPQSPSGTPLTLDANGEIPNGVGGNPQVRQFANDLINDRDTDKIPAKARAAAEALASRFGWSQGAFTPREMKQMLVAQNFLQQLQTSPALKALDSYVDRLAIEKAMDKSTGFVKQAVVMNLPKDAQDFIRLFNSAAGSIQGLSSVTRQGRATQGIVNLLRTELPNVLQSAGSTDAKDRIAQLLKEVTLAQQKNSTLRSAADNAPVSKNAPSVPSAQSGPEVWIRDASGKLVKQ